MGHARNHHIPFSFYLVDYAVTITYANHHIDHELSVFFMFLNYKHIPINGPLVNKWPLIIMENKHEPKLTINNQIYMT